MSEEQVEAFWQDAKVRVAFTDLRAYMAPNVLEMLRPPAWSFGSTPEQSDELLALVLDGRKSATASALRDYEAEGEDPPAVGTMSIVTDGSGSPRALVCTTEVHVVPFDQVDADHAHAEGEGDLSLEGWRDEHRRFFRDSAGGLEVDPDMPVVLERFKVLYTAR